MLKPRFVLIAWSLLACLSLPTAPATQVPPTPPTPEGFDADRWQAAWRLHHQAIVVDTHSDTTSRILDEDFDIGRPATDGHMDLPRIRAGGLDVQFYSIYVASRYFGNEDMSSRDRLRQSTPNASARRALKMIDGFYRSVARYQDQMEACVSIQDIEVALQRRRHAALMGIEGGHAIEGDLDLLRMFHRLGVRYMTLTHSNHNHFADSSGETPPRWQGLNRLGVKVVLEMNRLGMLVDVSHVSDSTFDRVLKVTRAPVILSHSSTRKLCDHPRNITDAMLQSLANNRGVIMINFNCGFLDARYGALSLGWEARLAQRQKSLRQQYPNDEARCRTELEKFRQAQPPPAKPAIDILIDHICHAVAIAGDDHVGLGSDFDGVPCVPKGIDDVSYLPRITYHLLQRGKSPTTIRKILGLNLLRVFRDVESVAQKLGTERPHRNDPKTDSLPPG